MSFWMIGRMAIGLGSSLSLFPCRLQHRPASRRLQETAQQENRVSVDSLVGEQASPFFVRQIGLRQCGRFVKEQTWAPLAARTASRRMQEPAQQENRVSVYTLVGEQASPFLVCWIGLRKC